MNPNLLFWTAALANLLLISGLALFGLRYARRGEIARHRRAMKLASLLVGTFVVAYVLKLALLGREDRSEWTLFDLWMLRIHELFVAQMMLAGAVAWSRVRRLQATRLVTRDAADPAPEPRDLRIHRIAGRLAVAGAVLSAVLAVGVLAGMYVRALG